MKAATPGETAREMTRRIEKSVGHVARVCGLFVTSDESIWRTKARDPLAPTQAIYN
jgi:hypothetical protein